jgi:hypothetical protein
MGAWFRNFQGKEKFEKSSAFLCFNDPQSSVCPSRGFPGFGCPKGYLQKYPIREGRLYSKEISSHPHETSSFRRKILFLRPRFPEMGVLKPPSQRYAVERGHH